MIIVVVAGGGVDWNDGVGGVFVGNTVEEALKAMNDYDVRLNEWPRQVFDVESDYLKEKIGKTWELDEDTRERMPIARDLTRGDVEKLKSIGVIPFEIAQLLKEVIQK